MPALPSNFHAVTLTVIGVLAPVALKIVGAILLFFIGRSIIRFTTNLMIRALQHQKIDHTLIAYAGTSLTVILNIILVVSILGFFGIQTTSFAALLAGVGLAVGAAWSGLLANFAAGIFLIVLRPFKVGDKISAAGSTGVVQTIGLFTTTINTSDNIQTHLGNNKILSGTIQNYSANPYRRVEIEAQLANTVDPIAARALLLAALPSIPNVVTTPAPVVEIMSSNFAGPVLTVRPYCHDKNYWQVYFATNLLIQQVFDKAGFPAAETPYVIRMAEPALIYGRPGANGHANGTALNAPSQTASQSQA